MRVARGLGDADVGGRGHALRPRARLVGHAQAHAPVVVEGARAHLRREQVGAGGGSDTGREPVEAQRRVHAVVARDVGAVEDEAHLPGGGERGGPASASGPRRRASSRARCSSPCAGRRRGRGARPTQSRTAGAPSATRPRSCPTSSERPRRCGSRLPAASGPSCASSPPPVSRNGPSSARASTTPRASSARAPASVPSSADIIRARSPACSRTSAKSLPRRLSPAIPRSALSARPYCARSESAAMTAREAIRAGSGDPGASTRATASPSIASGVSSVHRVAGAAGGVAGPIWLACVGADRAGAASATKAARAAPSRRTGERRGVKAWGLY